MNIKHCDCYSPNRKTGTTPRAVLPLPWFMEDKPRGYSDGVPIDACIAPAIERLWERGLTTLYSCCGHGRKQPNLVLDPDADPVRYWPVLAEIDDRAWTIAQWRNGYTGFVTFQSPLLGVAS